MIFRCLLAAILNACQSCPGEASTPAGYALLPRMNAFAGLGPEKGAPCSERKPISYCIPLLLGVRGLRWERLPHEDMKSSVAFGGIALTSTSI